MKMLKDLKEFLLRGNVVDLAVGVIIASALVLSLLHLLMISSLHSIEPSLEAAQVQNIRWACMEWCYIW